MLTSGIIFGLDFSAFLPAVFSVFLTSFFLAIEITPIGMNWYKFINKYKYKELN